MSEQTPIPEGAQLIGATPHMQDGKGRWQPVSTIRAQDLLEDETVRKIIGHADDLSAQVSRFKEHTFDDLGDFEALLAQEYETKRGGQKGNKTFMSYDGLMKVQVAVQDHIDFGPQLQVAKELIDECLNEWAAEANDNLRAIVTSAFNTDKPGQVNRSEIFMLLRQEIDDTRWKRAMDAIRDAMRVVGSKTYIRCYRRPTQESPWQAISIDLAKA